ncbi:MAG: phosphotransferase [Chloroflexi bacterium]|nr:MAG: phosphotransferase [Phototrophicales bacterium]RMF79869.1 MAG: phosphotransferase [Chloroflexota bacterium]
MNEIVDKSKSLGRADLHIHTTASDGLPTPQQVLDDVARRGNLDVIAITDHDTLDASLWAFEQRDEYPFDIVPGMEITSAGGHVLAWWIHEPIPGGLPLEETVAAIHAQGGIAVLAHPFEFVLVAPSAARYFHKPHLIRDAGVDAIEVYNAGVLTPGANRYARRIATDLKMPVVGNSDGHILEVIGQGVTCFRGRSAAELRHAIETGRTVAAGSHYPLKMYLKLGISLPYRVLRYLLASKMTR